MSFVSGLIKFNLVVSSKLSILMLSLTKSSSLSFLNQVILSANGKEVNLHVNSASWPSLIATLSSLDRILGESILIILQYYYILTVNNLLIS